MKFLGVIELLSLVVTVLSHRIDSTVLRAELVEGAVLRGQQVGFVEGSFGVLLTSLFLFSAIAPGWCLSRMCRDLGLPEGRRLWRRYAQAITGAVIVFSALGLSLFAAGESILRSVDPVLFLLAFIGIGLTLLSFLLRACLGTRAEALQKQPDLAGR